MRRALLFSCLLLAAAVARAGDPEIGDLAATASGNAVSVRFSLRNAFDNEELTRALQSGVATGFTYWIELIRVRPNWFDETVARSQIEVICTYNSVTQEYLLNYRRDRKLIWSETIGDLQILKQRMTSINEAALFPLDGYRPQKLAVRAKADVMRAYLLYLMPVEVSTGWSEARVKKSAP